MKATAQLRREHASILRQATTLAGLANSRMTREVAEQACDCIFAIDTLLVGHLAYEDERLYPLLAQSAEPAVRDLASSCCEEMGGIRGAWVDYRDQWTVDRILSEPDRFSGATSGIVGALAIRIEREDSALYPLLDQVLSLQARARRDACVA